MKLVQFTIDLDKPGITASIDPDPSGTLVRSAKAKGLSGPELDPLVEKTLTGALRITLIDEEAVEWLRSHLAQ